MSALTFEDYCSEVRSHVFVLGAAEFNLPRCPYCRAWRGDPCRDPSADATTPHISRLRIAYGKLLSERAKETK